MEQENSEGKDRRGSGQPKVRCLIVIGTRPEAIKLVPILRALRASPSIEAFVVTTGQHRDLVDPVLAFAGVTPHADLAIGQPGQTINDVCVATMKGIDQLLVEFRGGPERRSRPRMGAGSQEGLRRFPGFVVVHGDTTSAFAAGLASIQARLPVIHIEAGLRTGNRNSPFPEELNRTLLSCIASLHLSPTSENRDSLVSEGVDPDTIFVTGNTGVDALKWAASLELPWPDPRLEGLDDGREVVVVTAHRRENWGEGLQGIAEGVRRIASARPDVTFVLPLHPNPRVRAYLQPPLESLPNVILTDALDYVTFARLLKLAKLAITDSGGIQEEGPSVGTPVLVTRDTTERAEGVIAGTLKMVGTNPDVIAAEALHLLNDPAAYALMRGAQNPFGDGLAAERIVQAFEYLIFNGPAPQQFGPAFNRESVLKDAGYAFESNESILAGDRNS
ncbi:MAG: UDP-N-acetylglucosamine 2-epimerase (non-hydrolyzing) [Actinomycetota bacterium]|nr:UDP-N-acetylglucosamine 2-epimerase (non-hydrolyzing) [Actinomycetota bacterium]